MAKYSLLIFFAIFLANIHEYYAYTPPSATIEPLHPIGLRISIPDEHGITLMAVHVKFNEDFDGLEAGQIAKDILKVRNGRWTYQDKHTQLKRDDIIYYWIHVVYNGLGYNRIDQSHRVTDFYNYDGTKYISDTDEDPSCSRTSVTWIYRDNLQQQACPRQLIFEDNFDSLENSKWNSEKRFAGPPDSEFVVYMTNEVTDVSDGRLRIRPIVIDDKFGAGYVSRGNLALEDCTGEIGTEECQRQGAGSYILPPVISGRINTKGKFEFLFGRIEIKAKLPHGDWVYPVIILESSENTWALGMHREIRIASSVGNEDLTTSDGDVSGRLLCAGGLFFPANESNVRSANRQALSKRRSNTPWSNNYHVFEIEWKSGLITVKVDKVEYGEQVVDGSFGKPSYLTLGVAVGGSHEFEDNAMSNGYTKPWRNVEAKAMYKFYRKKDKWYPTWNAQTALLVDYVKVWAL